jgi:hypothetical protein
MDIAQEMRNALSQMGSDPKFIDLSYQDQSIYRAQVAQAYLAKDPDFSAMSPEDQQGNLQKIIGAYPPALKNKELETSIGSLVAKAAQGDAAARSRLSSMYNENGAMSGSGILSLMARAVSQTGTFPIPGGATPPLNPLPKGSADLYVGEDSKKVQEFFANLVNTNPEFSNLGIKVPTISVAQGKLQVGNARIAPGSLLGGAIDSVPFMFAPGGKLAQVGKDAAVAIGKKWGIRWLEGTAKVVLPKFLETTGMGLGMVAQQNALAAARSDPEGYTNTFQKLYDSFGTGAAMGFVMASALRGAATTVKLSVGATKTLIRGPVKAPKVALAELDSSIRAARGTSGVDPALLQTLDPSVVDHAWIKNYTNEAAKRLNNSVDLDSRPLDQTVIASLDAPGYWFAPKDWKNPEDGGFRIWQSVASKDNKNIEQLYIGEAANLTDMRSKLADVLASRYDSIDNAAQPEAMQASKALIAQGKLQQQNTKAYDPFPQETGDGFLKPVLRGYVSPTEAQDIAGVAIANKGQAYYVKVPATEDMYRAFADNKSPLNDGDTLIARPLTAEKVNAIVVLTKAAPPEAIAQAEAWAQDSAKRGGNWTPLEARKYYLIQNGYDGIVDPMTGTVESFFPSRVKLIIDKVDQKSGQLVANGNVPPAGGLGNKLSAQAKIQAAFGSSALANSPSALANVMTAKLKGTLNPRDVQNIFTQLSSAKQIGYNSVTIEAVAGTTNAIDKSSFSSVVRNADGSVVIRIPERVTGWDAQREFVSSLIDGIDELGKQSGKAEYTPIANKEFTKAVAKSESKYVLPFSNDETNFAWLRSVVYSEMAGSDLARVSGKVALVDNQGAVKKAFEDIYEARDYISRATLDPRFIRSDLYRQGYKLSGKQGEAYTITGPGVTTPIVANTLPEALDKLGYKPSRVSNRLAPREVTIGAERTIASFDGNAFTGSLKDAANALSRFEDPDELAKMVKINQTSEGDVFRLADNLIRVDVPRLGMHKYFTSLDEAKSFMGSDVLDITNLQDAARVKGLSLYFDAQSGGMTVGDGASIMTAGSPEEVANILKNYPDATGAREILSAIDPQADEALARVLPEVDPNLTSQWKANGFNAMQKYSPFEDDFHPTPTARGKFKVNARAVLRDSFASFDRYNEETINRQLGLTDLYHQLNTLKRSYSAKELANERDLAPLFRIFSDEKGKLLPEKRREAVGAYREAEGTPEVMERVKSLYGELSGTEQNALAKLKELTDSWATKFSVDPKTYVKGFVSHVRKWGQANWEEASKMVTADEVLNAAYGSPDRVPNQVRAYFHNSRAEDVINATMETDPLKIFHRYVDQGNKEFYMRQTTQNIVDYLNVNREKLPANDWQHVAEDLQAFGSYRRPADQIKVEQFLQGLHGKKALPDAGHKMLTNFMAITSISKLGFRVYPAVRQMIQPLQMLGGRLGMEPVWSATKHVLGSEGKSLLERYERQGVLSSESPYMQEISGTRTSKLARTSMRSLWTGDQVGRAICAKAAEDLLDEAVDAWNRGTFKGDIEKFIDYSKLDSIAVTAKPLVDEIARKATSGNAEEIASARLLFAKKMADEGNNDFTMAARPHFYRDSFVGKVLGQFGTWATAYRENMYRGWQNANTLPKKIGFASRTLGVGVGLATVGGALGINAREYMPGYGGLFAGGPAASYAIDAYRSPGSFREGTTSRESLELAFSPLVYHEDSGNVTLNYPSFLPGSLQFHYLKQMKEAIDSKDYWRAFLAATATPTTKK